MAHAKPTPYNFRACCICIIKACLAMTFLMASRDDHSNHMFEE